MKYMLIHCTDQHPTAWIGTIEVRPILGISCGSPGEVG